MDTAIRIACIAFSLLNGCQRAPDLAEMPVDDTQRAAAVEAANALRERFNRGECQAVYEDAGEFFRFQSPRRWLTDCEGLRAQYGTWESYTVSAAIRCEAPETTVCLIGPAKFTNGDSQLQAAWLMNNGEAHLQWLDLMHGGNWVRIAPRPIPRQRDPPPPEPATGTQS